MDFEPDGGAFAAPADRHPKARGTPDHIDSGWAPLDLLVMLLRDRTGLGAVSRRIIGVERPATLATRRAAAIDATKRLLAPPDSDVPRTSSIGAIRLRSRRPLADKARTRRPREAAIGSARR